jgi:hypothetical protein
LVPTRTDAAASSAASGTGAGTSSAARRGNELWFQRVREEIVQLKQADALRLHATEKASTGKVIAEKYKSIEAREVTGKKRKLISVSSAQLKNREVVVSNRFSTAFDAEKVLVLHQI